MNHMTQHDHNQMTEPHENHDRHAGHSVAMFRDKFWLTLTLTVPTVFWSADVQHWLGGNGRPMGCTRNPVFSCVRGRIRGRVTLAPSRTWTLSGVWTDILPFKSSRPTTKSGRICARRRPPDGTQQIFRRR
jgi:hypothetical protein